jgi:hypothetical protein
MRSFKFISCVIVSVFITVSCATDITVPSPVFKSDASPSLGVKSLTMDLPDLNQDLRSKGVDRLTGKGILPYNEDAFSKVLAYSLVTKDADYSGDEGYTQSSSRYYVLTLNGQLIPGEHAGILKPVYLDKEGWENLDQIILQSFPENPSSKISVNLESSIWFDAFQTNRTLDSTLINAEGTAFCIGQLTLSLTSPSGKEEKNIYAFADKEYSATWSTQPPSELLAELYQSVLEELKMELGRVIEEIQHGESNAI